MKILINSLFLTVFILYGQNGNAEERIKIDKWIVSGEIQFPKKDNAVNYEAVLVRILHRANTITDSKPWIAPRGISEIKSKGKFELKPQLLGNRPSPVLWSSQEYVVIAKSGKRFSSPIKFTAKTNPEKVPKVTLKFGEPSTHILKARIVHMRTGKPVPDLKINLTCFGGQHENDYFGEWDMGTATTDSKGIISVSGLPKKRFKISDANWGYIQPIGKSGTPVDGVWPKSLPQSEIEKNEKLTTLYYLERGNGIFWSNSLALYSERKEVYFAKANDTLECQRVPKNGKAPANQGEKASEIFELNVDAKGCMKSPVVEHGIFRFTITNSGRQYSKNIHIIGIGSMGLFRGMLYDKNNRY